MMTTEEKIAMFKDKRDFIANISKAFEANPRGSTVASIKYEVYKHDTTSGHTYYAEYLTVTFAGGAVSVKNVNGNSNTANLRALGTMVDGGYYDEVQDYQQTQDMYEYVDLTVDDAVTLEMLLDRLGLSIQHISDLRRCFSLCRNEDDINKVLDAIPLSFGQITIVYPNDESFIVRIEDEEEQFDFYI